MYGNNNRKNRPPFIGIGTGRCGTQSLSILINACEYSTVTHEEHLLDWYTPNPNDLEELIAHLAIQDDFLRGEISLSLLPRIPYLRERIPELKIIHIFRDKELVTESFNKAHTKTSRLIPRMREIAYKKAKHRRDANKSLHPLAGSPEIFPIIDAYTTRESYRKYWDYYIEEADKLSDVLHIDVEDLKDNDALDTIFNYLNIPTKDRNYLEKRRYNVIGKFTGIVTPIKLDSILADHSKLSQISSIIAPRYNDVKLLRQNVYEFMNEILPTIHNSRVLEIGPATKAQFEGLKFINMEHLFIDSKKILENQGNTYISCDINKAVYADYSCSITELPKYIKSGSLDVVMAFEFLEHMSDFWKLPRILNDLLADNGKLFLSTPFYCRHHDPKPDYWRFTEDGLQLLFDDYFDIYLTKLLWKSDDGQRPVHYTLRGTKR